MANTLKFGNGEWYGKEGTILAYNDLNSNYKPLPFNFSRASKATVINKDGLIETVGSGQPRVDYKDDSKGALLLEPSRTNLIPNSNNITTWNDAGMTTTLVNDLVNPSNVLGGTKLSQNSSGGYVWLSRTFTGNETFSAFVKKDSSNFARLYAANNTVYFDIANGTIETEVGNDITDKSIINYGNGWFRISISVNSTAASYVRIYPASSGSSSSGTNSLFVYGAQLEAGSYGTSLINTQGSAVTRVADICSQTVPDGIIGQTEGAIYFEFEDLDYSYTSIARAISLSDGTSANRIYIAQLSSGAMYAITTGGCEIQETAPSGRRGNLKVAFGYKNNDCVLYVNGVLAGVDNSATTPICSKVHLGNFNSTANLNKPYKEVKLYNTRLSNAELQALTT